MTKKSVGGRNPFLFISMKDTAKVLERTPLYLLFTSTMNDSEMIDTSF